MKSKHYRNIEKLFSIILIVLIIQFDNTYGNPTTRSRTFLLNTISISNDKQTVALSARNTLKQAKAKKNWELLADTYRELLYKANKKEVLKYADSMFCRLKTQIIGEV
jgi:hypothetical protein